MIIEQAIATALQQHREGRLEEAERLYREVLAYDAENFDALHLLGISAHQRGDHVRALDLIDRALKINAFSAEAHYHRGEVLRAVGKLDAARASGETAVRLRPAYAEGHNGLGLTLAYQGLLADACDAFRRSVQYNPTYAGAFVNLGSALVDLARPAEAIECFEKAIAIDGDLAIAHIMLGKALRNLGREAEALAKFQEGLAVDPKIAKGHLYLGYMMQEQGLLEDAFANFEEASRLEPDDVEMRWALVMSQIAAVHTDDSSVVRSRERFTKALNELDSWLDASRAEPGANSVGQQQPFFLAYEETSNVELLSKYGDMCSRLMQDWQRRNNLQFVPNVRSPGAKIKVGIVSGQLRNHSVWHAVTKGWVRQLDRSQISLHLFHTGTDEDNETAIAKSRADSFIAAPRPFRQLIREILDSKLDVLIYPEIGMDSVTLKLASMRLAPVQATSWGHPETSGLPTIDYYLSAEDFEPEEADPNYRERLIRLPHLGSYFEPFSSADVEFEFEEFGVDTSVPLLISAGAPFKYSPRHDYLFIEIAKRLQRCQFVFFHHSKENLSAAIEQRLELAFEKAGLYFHQYAIFLPRLKSEAFHALMRRANVYLDTIGFSGFNTAIQAIECRLPIVTMEGRFMRGRLASGILKRLGMRDLAARSEHEYVKLAVRLASDERFACEIRQEIESRRDALFRDTAPTSALVDFLRQVAQQQGPST
jgi:predicted O-linked N-acetylglucosamine transferase (SPINDLY family)